MAEFRKEKLVFYKVTVYCISPSQPRYEFVVKAEQGEKRDDAKRKVLAYLEKYHAEDAVNLNLDIDMTTQDLDFSQRAIVRI